MAESNEIWNRLRDHADKLNRFRIQCYTVEWRDGGMNREVSCYMKEFVDRDNGRSIKFDLDTGEPGTLFEREFSSIEHVDNYFRVNFRVYRPLVEVNWMDGGK